MKRFAQYRPSPAMLVAWVALLVALGGTSYAAIVLPANTVGTKQIKKNAVTTPKIKGSAVTSTKLKGSAVTSAKLKNGAVTSAKLGANAVNGAKVADNSLTGSDINVGTLPKVPAAAAADNATNAATATNAGHASASAAVDRIDYESASVALPASGAVTKGTATCPAGLTVVGGGAKVTQAGIDALVYDSYPDGRGAWSADALSFGSAAETLTVSVICTAAVGATP